MTAKSLTGEFFQLGYVTRNLDRAIALYRERYGVTEWLRFDTASSMPPGTPGPFMEVALAYNGPVMLELIQPAPSDPGIYGEALRDDGGVNLHHLGYLSEEPRFGTLATDYEAQGFDVPVKLSSPMGLSLIYVDTRSDNGLYSEYVCLAEGGKQFFGQVPRNN